MTSTQTNIIFGTLAAVLLGIWLVKRDGDGDVGDEIGDALVLLTSSEESRLQQLEPETQAQVRALIQTLANGVDDGTGTGVLTTVQIHVGQTLRTTAQEKQAISSGHSAVKTHSWHELGRAADLYPINPDTGSPDLSGTRNDLFYLMQTTAESMGFRQLAYNSDGSRRYINGANGPIWDGGHVEWHGDYSTIAEAVAAEGPNYGIT